MAGPASTTLEQWRPRRTITYLIPVLPTSISLILSNTARRQRGMMPCSSSIKYMLEALPIVCVFPLPVWPYARTVAWSHTQRSGVRAIGSHRQKASATHIKAFESRVHERSYALLNGGLIA